jgi:hypothetical protein
MSKKYVVIESEKCPVNVISKKGVRVKVAQRPNVRLKITRGFSILINRGATGAPGQNGADGYNGTSPTAIVDGTTYAVPAGKKVDSISVVPAAGVRLLTVGYSSGTGEVVDAEEISSNDGASFHVGKYYHAGKTLHFSGFTGSVLIYLL